MKDRSTVDQVWFSLLGLLMIFGCYQERNESIRLMNAGVKYSLEGRDESAISKFEQAGKVDPTNHRAYFNLGVVHQKKKRLAQAASAFEKAVAVKPERGEYLYQYAMSLQELGQCDKAIPVLRKSSEVQPAHAETWLRLGECQLRLEKFDAAQDTLIRAINSKPLLAKSYLNLGRLYSDFRQFKHAIQTYRTGIDVLSAARDSGYKARGLDDVILALHQDLGTVYGRIKKIDKAVEVLSRARKLRKDEPSTLFNLGMMLKDVEGQEAEAQKVLKRFISLSGSGQTPWRKRAAEEAYDKLKARAKKAP